MIPMVAPQVFKELVGKRGGARTIKRADLPLVGLRKAELGDVERVDDRTLRFCISTGCIDRDLDRINQAGWALDHFAKNPRVLWAHNAQMPPIGKATDFGVAGDRLMATVKFLPAEGYGSASAWADQIYNLAKDGWLSATSVGFRPLKYDFTEDPDRGGDDWWPGIDFHEQELVELSIVNVPSNPEALIEPPTDTAAPLADTGKDRRQRAIAEILCRVNGGPRGWRARV